MKKILYTLLLILETCWGLFAVLLLLSWGLWKACIITLLLFAAIMIFLVKRLKQHVRNGNTVSAARTRIGIAFAMLLPIVPAFFVVLAIAMTLAIHG